MRWIQVKVPPVPQLLRAGRCVPGGYGMAGFNDGAYTILFIAKGSVAVDYRDGEPCRELPSGTVAILEPRCGSRIKLLPGNAECYYVQFIAAGGIASLGLGTGMGTAMGKAVGTGVVGTATATATTAPATGTAMIPGTGTVGMASRRIPGNGHGVGEPASEGSETISLPAYSRPDAEEVLPILEKLMKASSPCTVEQMFKDQTLFLQLLLGLCHAPEAERADRSAEISQLVINYLHYNSAEDFNMKQMEAELHYHFNYLSRCLKKHTGMTPLQYLQYIRMEKAKELLKTTNYTVQNVAEHVGIGNYNYFIRLFKKREHVTPAGYRQKCTSMR